jgi:hemolysin activation/secretion protein
LINSNTTPNDISQLANVQVGISVPVGHDGLVVDVDGSYTAVRPGDDLRSLDINGNSSNLSLGIAYPLIRSRQRNLYATASFDALNSETTIGPQQVVISRDRLRVVRLGLNGNISDPTGVTSASAQLSQGIGGLGATTTGTPEAPLSRVEGEADFTMVNVNVSRFQELPDQFNLLVSGTAQISRSPLLSSERFGLGGVSLGSAFDGSQVTGDSGYGLRIELQRPFLYQGWDIPLSTRPYLFADYGQVFTIRPTAVEQGTDSLGSVGFGLRQGFSDWGNLSLELAFPTVRPSNAQAAGTRLFFGLDFAY